MARFRGETLHETLGPDFFDPVTPADFPQTILRYRNRRWARRVGLEDLSDAEWIEHFGRFIPLPGSLERPLALRYHGHQFQAYNPDLGDGRGFLFAQMRDLEDGRLLDLGTKGSGTTPWSRGGDGRLTLKGGVREILASEMLEARGVDTSKGFSLIETGEDLYRADEPSPARSAVLVRLSHSHIRIGTFQRLSFLNDTANLEKLTAYCLAHYYPGLQNGAEAPAVKLLGAVTDAVARTGAQWIAAGFVHGVLNTDNINITGESFDFGPWRFLPRYEPGFTAAYFDQTGLYAFSRQPDALAWNLTRFAECLVDLAETEALEAALNGFWPAFQRHLAGAVAARLGVSPPDEAAGRELMAAFFSFLEAERSAYEQVYFDLYADGGSEDRLAEGPNADAYRGETFKGLKAALAGCRQAPGASREHPYFARSGPVAMLVEDVEAVWEKIEQSEDWSGFEQALDEIAQMGSAMKASVSP